MSECPNLKRLLEHLEEDLSWRKAEISKLFIIYSGDKETVLAKSIVLFIYSHWEGYIKNATKQYLYCVSECNIKTSQLSRNFEAMVIKNIIASSRESASGLTLTNEIKLLDKIEKNRHSIFKLKKELLQEKNKEFINTQSNLTLSNLNKILIVVGLPKLVIPKPNDKYLDSDLLDQRHTIGHGTKINPQNPKFRLKEDDLYKLRNFVYLIMEYIRDELIYYAEKQLYLVENKELLSEREKTRLPELSEHMERILNPDKFKKKAKSSSF
ncbi:TPA: MAE_28990/MAE_18760 family HEPN-like nuclease [Vibrio alginolyticus]